MTHLKFKANKKRRPTCFYKTLIFFTLFFSCQALSNPLAGFTKIGEAKLRVIFWDIYHSKLYSSNGIYDANEFPQALEISYLRAINSKDLVKHTKEEWQKLGIPSNQIDKWIPQLKDIFPNINKSDTLLLTVNDEKSSEFFLNQKSIGVITDQQFGESFLRIWLDEHASYPKVRDKLLGKSNN
ncbi:chalcone isomerase family protein [Paraglaciecola sp.]|uniref:chalcone isomerase family protein n=1 Tax=Paraglaciecola sp. TaxID=1920173 RepID=UPI0032654939